MSTNPTITHVMQPVLPGHLAVVTVGAMSDDVTIYLHRIKNSAADLPGGEPGAAGNGTPLKIVQRKGDCVTVDIPRGTFGALAFSLSQEFDPATAVVVNTPRLDWTYPERATATPDAEFRIMGRNMVAANHYRTKDPANPVSYGGLRHDKTRVVARREGSRRFIEIPVKASSGYEARLEIPRSLKPGVYEFFAHNGHGGPLGWSPPLRVHVEAPVQWPNKIFRVDDLLGTSVSDDDAIARALEAAEQNGGGIVLLGPRVYALHRTIVMPRYTVLRGAGSGRTLLQLPTSNGPRQPFVAITGDGDFTVEDLRVFSLYAPMLVCAPQFTPETFEAAFGVPFDFVPGKRAQNVTVRRCHLIMRINSHEDRRVDNDDDRYKEFVRAYTLSQGQGVGGFTAITFRGDGLEVTDNTIYGGGSGVILHGSTACRVANNVIEIGPAGHGIYAMGHLDWPPGPPRVNGGAPVEGSYCKQIVIEDSEVSGYSQTARDGVYLMYGVEKSHVARNRIANIESTFDAEGLGLHLWSARWNHAGLEMESPTRGRIIDPTEEIKYECLDGAQIEIVDGHGIGQLRRILQRDGDFVELDAPWAYPPDATSKIAYTSPPLFSQVTLVDNTIFNTGANLIMWGSTNDCVVDGNRLADGPHLGIWSVRVEGDQKVWGGAAFVSVINNVNEMGWIAPRDADLPNILLSTGQGAIGNPSCTFGDSEKGSYDFLGLVIRNNATINNSGIFFRKTFPMYGSTERWVVNDYGVVIEGNHCRDSRVGVVIEQGAAVVERDNTFERVDHEVIWAVAAPIGS
jgi:hypothetical protein